MEAVGEADDVFAALDVTGDLQCRFHRVGAGGAGELDHVVHVARLEHVVFQRLQKVALGHGVHVQAVHDGIVLDVVEQDFFQNRIVVAVVQRARAGQKIQVLLAVFVVQIAALGFLEHHREAACVALNFGLNAVKNIRIHGSLYLAVSQFVLGVVAVERPDAQQMFIIVLAGEMDA